MKRIKLGIRVKLLSEVFTCSGLLFICVDQLIHRRSNAFTGRVNILKCLYLLDEDNSEDEEDDGQGRPMQPTGTTHDQRGKTKHP